MNSEKEKIAKFQLTRSVGSVTKKRITELGQAIISTHTLRGERDTYTI